MADKPTPEEEEEEEEEEAEESGLFWIGIAFAAFVLAFCVVLVWITWKHMTGS